MAMTPEGKVKAAVKTLLKSMDVWYYLPVSNGMGQHGIPDFICCVPNTGKFLAIETKAPGRKGNVSPLQAAAIEGIRKRKGWAIVVDDVSQVREFFKEQGHEFKPESKA